MSRSSRGSVSREKDSGKKNADNREEIQKNGDVKEHEEKKNESEEK